MRENFAKLAPIACSLLFWTGAVQAQANEEAGKVAEAPPAPALTGSVTLASQYVSRGIRQTWDKPALQAGLDYVHPSGWSVGTWMSNVSKHFIEDGLLEWDIYGGYNGTVGDVGYSALLYYYKYPRAEIHATGTKFNYTEVSLGLTYKFLYAKYNRTVSRDFFGITNARGTGYLDIGANYDMGSGYTLNLHLGDGRVAGAGNDFWDWQDMKVGVTKALDKGWSVALAYTKARSDNNGYSNYTTGIPNANGVVEYKDVAKGTLVVSVSKAF
ncbi:TorF family putative porin [Massilia sp. erpn]|uniref:TorF family putative porin n=1 Tax=Massilia sp. erpn TaxID=2738142 RepID=UPI002105D4CE|nr:TorF family putative porin [Massilia sp. erpn]UTY59634.1 choline dehydrogenase [Massilia sp. erpn]